MSTSQIILLALQITNAIVNFILLIVRSHDWSTNDYRALSFLFSFFGFFSFIFYLVCTLPIPNNSMYLSLPSDFHMVFYIASISGFILSDIFIFIDKIPYFKHKK